MTASTEFLLRRRRWVAGLLAALIGLLSRKTPIDTPQFAELGQHVLAGRFAEAYSGSFTQAGPLQLVLSRIVLFVGPDGRPPAMTRIVLDVALTLGAMAACRGRPVREAAAAVLALLWLLGPTPWSGHPAEVAIPILWAYATMVNSRGRWLAAAAALGVSVLIAPIGVLGFPCLLASTGLMRSVRTALAGAGVAIVGYLPFVLSGQFGMFGIVWQVDEGTLPHLLGLPEITWATRLGQAIVVAGGCAIVAYLLRGRLVAVAAAPLAAALLRVATDPLDFDYYWLPVSVGTVLLVGLLPDDSPPWRHTLVFLMGYGTMLTATTDQGPVGALMCLMGYVVAGVPVRRSGLRRTSAAKERRYRRSRQAHRDTRIGDASQRTLIGRKVPARIWLSSETVWQLRWFRWFNSMSSPNSKCRVSGRPWRISLGTWVTHPAGFRRLGRTLSAADGRAATCGGRSRAGEAFVHLIGVPVTHEVRP